VTFKIYTKQPIQPLQLQINVTFCLVTDLCSPISGVHL